MRLALTLGFLGLLLGQPALARAEGSLHKQAVDWMEENYRFGSDDELFKKVVDQIDKDIDDGNDFIFSFGDGLTKSGEPVQIHGFGGDFFSFDLTKSQAKTMDLGEKSIQYLGGKHRGKPADEMLAKLGVPKIDNDDNLDGSAKITGKIPVKTLKSSSEKLAIRLSYRIGKSGSSSFYYLENGLPDEKGNIKFSFGPINGKDDKPYSGPLVVFLELCTVKEKDNDVDITVYSNTVGTLLDVASSDK